MPVRSVPLLCISLLAVLTGCAGQAATQSASPAAHQSTVPSPRPSASASPAQGLSALIAQLSPLIKEAAETAPDLHRSDVSETGVIVTTNSPNPCPKTGMVQDMVDDSVIAVPSSTPQRDPAPAARAFLESKGWHFSGWDADGDTRNGRMFAGAVKNGVTLIIDFSDDSLDVEAQLPCLPGQPAPDSVG